MVYNIFNFTWKAVSFPVEILVAIVSVKVIIIVTSTYVDYIIKFE